MRPIRPSVLVLLGAIAWTWMGIAGCSDSRPAGTSGGQAAASHQLQEMSVTAGAYYFDGWAGHLPDANDPANPWKRNAPAMLRERMVREFADREPIWGWRDDSLEVMEKQIDLAADSGLEFFAFCWYWHDNRGGINARAIRQDPKHTALELFLKARNNHRMRFCLLVANHEGFEINGAENWRQAGEFWLPYFKHPRHLTVGGRPLVIVFNAKGGDRAGFEATQQVARDAGLSGLAIAGCGSLKPEMGYTHQTHYNSIPGYWDGSAAHPYTELVKAQEALWSGSRQQPYMPIVIAGWDKRPWETSNEKGKAAWYYPDRTPEQFARHVTDAIAWMDKHPDQTTAERIMLIYAWNEFGEGGYIAPTRGDPEGRYLEALRAVLKPPPQPGR